MATASEAFAVLRGILEAGLLLPLRWQNEDADSGGAVALPDTPAAFVYTIFEPQRAELVSFGGGRGQNRYRNPATLDMFVFVPRGQGLAVAMDYAETAATLFRSYRDTTVSCFAATVYAGGSGAELRPPGLASEVNAYFYAAVEVELFYDLIG